jgi:hypothetical protein
MVLEGEEGNLVKVAVGILERGKAQTDKTSITVTIALLD